MDFYEHCFEVQYCDVGQSNKLTNRGFLRFLQEAASIASSRCGYGLNDVSITHVAWILLNWKLKVFSRPVWNSKVVVRTWPKSFNKFYSFRDFEVFDENNNLVAVATSKWVLIDSATGNISKITPEISNVYVLRDKSVFVEPFCDKLRCPDDFEFSKEFMVSKRDIDTNVHMNNLCYLDYAYEVLPDDLEFNNVEIMYKHAAVLGDLIKCSFVALDDASYINISSSDFSKLHAVVKLY